MIEEIKIALNEMKNKGPEEDNTNWHNLKEVTVSLGF